MAIRGLTQSAFEGILNEYVKPSSPIETYEHLVDRDRQLQRIEEAITRPAVTSSSTATVAQAKHR